jgi:hypothetical protein
VAKDQLTVRVHIDGLRETLAALNKLPKDATQEIREKATELAKEMAAAAASAGREEGRQAALVARTVKARRDRVPVVVAGGNKRLGRNRAPAYKLLFGSEFGATQYRQFRPHLGSGSYWFFKTVDENQVEISAKWQEAADAIIQKFGGQV